VLQRNQPGSKGRRFLGSSFLRIWRALVHENLHGQIAAELGSRRRVLISWAQNACVVLFSSVYAWIVLVFLFLLGMHVVMQWVAPVEHKSQCSSKAVNKH